MLRTYRKDGRPKEMIRPPKGGGKKHPSGLGTPSPARLRLACFGRFAPYLKPKLDRVGLTVGLGKPCSKKRQWLNGTRAPPSKTFNPEKQKKGRRSLRGEVRRTEGVSPFFQAMESLGTRSESGERPRHAVARSSEYTYGLDTPHHRRLL